MNKNLHDVKQYTEFGLWRSLYKQNMLLHERIHRTMKRLSVSDALHTITATDLLRSTPLSNRTRKPRHNSTVPNKQNRASGICTWPS